MSLKPRIPTHLSSTYQKYEMLYARIAAIITTPALFQCLWMCSCSVIDFLFCRVRLQHQLRHPCPLRVRAANACLRVCGQGVASVGSLPVPEHGSRRRRKPNEDTDEWCRVIANLPERSRRGVEALSRCLPLSRGRDAIIEPDDHRLGSTANRCPARLEARAG